MRSFASALLLLAVSTLPACTLYFDGDDDDVADDGPCFLTGGSPREPLSPELLRNPETGACESVGGGGGGCEDWCGPCAQDIAIAPASRDWGQCYSACDGREELECIETSGCRAAYAGNPAADEAMVYQGCWATAPSGPVQGGGCTNLDAQDCSRHDDCSPVHLSSNWKTESAPSHPVPPIPSTFVTCIDELAGGGCYSDNDCAADEYCTAGTECMNPPGCNPGEGCPPVCYGRCIPNPGALCESIVDEAGCVNRTDCLPVYIGEDCECTPGTCSCEELTFDRCMTR